MITTCATYYLATGYPETPLHCKNFVEEGEEYCNVCRDHRSRLDAARNALLAPLTEISRRGCLNVSDGLSSCLAHNLIPKQRVTLCSACLATAALQACVDGAS